MPSRLIALAALVAVTGLRAAQAPVPAPADRPVARTDRNSAIAHAQLLDKARRGRIDVYFAGDSITRRWGATDYPEFLAHWTQQFFGWNAANFGWGADTTQNILWRLENGELDGVHPKAIVLLAGTNNVGSAPSTTAVDERAEDVSRGIKAILDVMRRKAPQATIILTAIFPRNDAMAAMPVIDAINRRIAGFADGRSIRWLNVNGQLADASGTLFDGMMGDRLHPTLKGYQVWADGLEPILRELLGPRAADDRAPPPTGDPSKPAPAQAATAPAPRVITGRERLSINDGWRFVKDDPPGTGTALLYDVRPAITDARDDRPADAEPEQAAGVRASAPTIKPWILPTANPFIKDPARRHTRPAGNPGENTAYVRREFDDRGWRRVNLPHDWAIEGPFLTTGPHGGMGRLPSWGVAWYRKQLTIPGADAGKSIFLDVDGAMSYATVWLNGQLVGGWPFGYASWRLDLTPYIVPGGVNQLAIRLDNPPSSSRWYPGGGLYRNVWLTKTPPLHVGHWGTFIRSRIVSAASATVDIDVTIDNNSSRVETVRVATSLYALDDAGRRTGAAVATVAPVDVTVAARSNAAVSGSATIDRPRLWGPPPTQRPHRYVAVTTVSQGARLVDSYDTRFGVRDLRFDARQGLLVNGEGVVIKGVNQHHDLGALGAAFNVRAAERQLEILQEMGANAIRMAHNPPAPELLDLTDRLGLLVVNELFDVWERRKTPLDFHLIFPDWHEADARAWVRRDRNHPSVIMWSTGNEVGEQYSAEEGAAVARRLRDIVREEDPTRPTTASMNYAKPDTPFAAATDVISLNYQGEGIRDAPEYADLQGIRTPPLYPAFREAFPDKLIVSSENAAAVSSRGEYLFPVTSSSSAPVRDGSGGHPSSRQVSAYELYTAPFGSSADKVFASLDAHPYVAGGFVWSGWDYLGEPTPYYAARSSYFGIIDLAGFKKDRFFLYQSQWRPDLPMAHILPHWTWPAAGLKIPVHLFTSGDEAELFLNGRSLGRKRKQPGEYRLRWDDVLYEPGTLEAVAYKRGVKWATDTVRTVSSGSPVLDLRPDRRVIAGDGLDLSFVTARVVDRKGVLWPRGFMRIRFTVDGPGEIVATDNGNPASFTPFQSHEREAFNGLALVIVRAKPGATGRITVTASSDGLLNGVLAEPPLKAVTTVIRATSRGR